MLTESPKHSDHPNIDASNNLSTSTAKNVDSGTDESSSMNPQVIGEDNCSLEETEQMVKPTSARDTICALSGHSFLRKSLSKPAYCHHCGEVIWSPLSTGFACDVCNFLSHERCLREIVTVCPAYASTQILTPVAHCWSELSFFRRKFCNVCRIRLRDTPSVRCEEQNNDLTPLAGGQPSV
uniref:Phorbol-ester/DAG-type domain-containing protein n=1 Tax=Mesocestoides corti TaxID=53468 RepID=A0A5K3FHX4_MESCO